MRTRSIRKGELTVRFVFKVLRKLVGLMLIPAGFLFSVYWFDLDKKLLRKFEPTFREMAEMVKQMKAAHAQ